MAFIFRDLDGIPDVKAIEPEIYRDERGWFKETHSEDSFARFGIGPFVQDNVSFSSINVLRGLHFQLPPKAQGKLVQCLSGKIWDVAVDIRKGSPTFGKWVAEHLSADNHHMLWLPAGFAHGFVVLSETALVMYKVTAPYAPDLDHGIRWDDPDLAIRWPISSPVVSDKDQKLPGIRELELG
ncbi:MAG: dTDP-4-dehydrorhamnose 3,5-epimerase [Acidobacteria bacterium]|nr:dTDP-4-dehydrorhamnose 3,5-epimerase [Acidobacteriota bacterium]